MPWVPIEESGMAYAWFPYSDSVTLNNSVVQTTNNTEVEGRGWDLWLDDGPVRVRVTALSYSTSHGSCDPIGPATIDIGTPSGGSNRFENDRTDAWDPEVIEPDEPATWVQYWGTAFYPGCEVNESFSFFVEVFVESGLVAADDEAETRADTPVTVDVLANDTFNDEPVTLDHLDGPPTIDQQPANGTVSVAPDGKITYTPNPGFTGTDEFVYRIATPEPSVICGFFGEGFAVISVPEGFSLDEPITFSVGDQSMEMHWAPWGGRWEPNFDDDYFYPSAGDRATMSQGGMSVEGDILWGFVLGNSGGQDWQVSPELPWFEFVVETEDGNTYYATESAFNAVSFPDGAPPIPEPGSPYPIKIRYQDEVDVHELCGLVYAPTD